MDLFTISNELSSTNSLSSVNNTDKDSRDVARKSTSKNGNSGNLNVIDNKTSDYKSSDFKNSNLRNSDFKTSEYNTSGFGTFSNNKKKNINNSEKIGNKLFGGGYDDVIAPANIFIDNEAIEKLNNVVGITNRMMRGGARSRYVKTINNDYSDATTETETTSELGETISRINRKNTNSNLRNDNDNDSDNDNDNLTNSENDDDSSTISEMSSESSSVISFGNDKNNNSDRHSVKKNAASQSRPQKKTQGKTQGKTSKKITEKKKPKVDILKQKNTLQINRREVMFIVTRIYLRQQDKSTLAY